MNMILTYEQALILEKAVEFALDESSNKKVFTITGVPKSGKTALFIALTKRLHSIAELMNSLNPDKKLKISPTVKEPIALYTHQYCDHMPSGFHTAFSIPVMFPSRADNIKIVYIMDDVTHITPEEDLVADDKYIVFTSDTKTSDAHLSESFSPFKDILVEKVLKPHHDGIEFLDTKQFTQLFKDIYANSPASTIMLGSKTGNFIKGMDTWQSLQKGSLASCTPSFDGHIAIVQDVLFLKGTDTLPEFHRIQVLNTFHQEHENFIVYPDSVKNEHHKTELTKFTQELTPITCLAFKKAEGTNFDHVFLDEYPDNLDDLLLALSITNKEIFIRRD